MAETKLKPNHPTALAATSYQSPYHSDSYGPLKGAIREKIPEMGFDRETAVEVGVVRGEGDEAGRVNSNQYIQWANICNFRVLQSFEPILGAAKFADLISARNIGVLVKSFETDLKLPVSFPDQVLVANHLLDLKADSYYSITTIWSVNQQAVVAEIKGWVTFFDYEKGQTVDLREKGGEWGVLWAFLRERLERERGLVERWEGGKVRAKI